MPSDKALMLQEYTLLLFGDNEDYNEDILNEVSDLTLLWCSGIARILRHDRDGHYVSLV